jgi:ketosteroid isomerase-like protein
MSHENVKSLLGARITLPPRGNNTGQRRTPEEQLAVRFPGISLFLARSFMRLSPRSRLRRLLVTRRIQQVYAAANRRDYESVLSGWDAASEYRPTRELMPPDLDATFHGHDGMHQLWRYWRDAFEDIRWDPEEILDLGDKILVTAQQTGHGTGSGIAVSQPVFQLFTLRKGLVVRQEDFLDRPAALEAAGLRE